MVKGKRKKAQAHSSSSVLLSLCMLPFLSKIVFLYSTQCLPDSLFGLVVTTYVHANSHHIKTEIGTEEDESHSGPCYATHSHIIE